MTCDVFKKIYINAMPVGLLLYFIASCTQKKSFETNAVAPAPTTGSIDEEKPSFVDLPHLEFAPQPDAASTGAQPTGPVAAGTGQLGVDPDAKCETYIEKFWKVGAQTIEDAPGPFGTRITFTTRVLARTGNQVTVRTLLQTPDATQNIDEQITFDACTEGAKSAIPTSMVGCTTAEIGNESISVQGRSLLAKKIRIGPCSSATGKSYDTTVWRVNELPLWGIAKREVRGSIVPSVLGGVIAAQTTQGTFAD